ncbi:hypothetical protein GCM10009872_10480 [Actinopolymorpha rutila]
MTGHYLSDTGATSDLAAFRHAFGGRTQRAEDARRRSVADHTFRPGPAAHYVLPEGCNMPDEADARVASVTSPPADPPDPG